MVDPQKLEKWRKAIRAKFPVIGTLRLSLALKAMEASRNEPQVIPLLVDVLRCNHDTFVSRASAALSALTALEAVDALCSLWADDRDERLGTIIAQRQYVARGPARVRALSTLQAGALAALADADAPLVKELILALKDSDAQIVGGADAALRGLRNPDGVDAL